MNDELPSLRPVGWVYLSVSKEGGPKWVLPPRSGASPSHAQQAERGSLPVRRVTKGSVNYREAESPTERCDTCDMFNAPHGCDLVKGWISPDGVCDRWIPIPVKESQDGSSV